MLFKDDTERKINNCEKEPNLLLEGDNLDSLFYLNKYYNSMVDIIYIDPPYNTGNNKFKYSDKYTRNDWLNFMKVRLKLALPLLKETGVVFISIDDNEQAYLKILCDEIFGEENYVGDLIRKTKSMTNNIKNGFNMQHEYTLVYAKDKSNLKFVGKLKDVSKYSNPDNDENGEWCNSDPTSKYMGKGERKEFKIINPYTHKIDVPPNGREWVFSQDNLDNYIKSGKIKFKKNHRSSERGFIYKRYLNELRSSHENINSLDFIDNDYMNQVGTRECNQLGIHFSYPKPVGFIKSLISYFDDDSLILDFFAGSGTTGQAVLELNQEDGGKRKFILCQNNENNICEDITYNRLKTVITGVRPDGSVYGDKLDENLTYLRMEGREE